MEYWQGRWVYMATPPYSVSLLLCCTSSVPAPEQAVFCHHLKSNIKIWLRCPSWVSILACLVYNSKYILLESMFKDLYWSIWLPCKKQQCLFTREFFFLHNMHSLLLLSKLNLAVDVNVNWQQFILWINNMFLQCRCIGLKYPVLVWFGRFFSVKRNICENP